MLQAQQQTDAALWQRRHLIDEPPSAWLAKAAPGLRIGYDPMLLSEEAVQRYADAGCTLVALAANPLDAVWPDRPAPPLAQARVHPLALAGSSAADKREALAQGLREVGQDAAVISDPASIAWLLNLRGGDLAYTPVALGFAVLRADASVDLFMAPEKLGPVVREALGNAVAVQGREALGPALATCRAGACGSIRRRPRPGSRRPCAMPGRRWSPAPTRVCCPRPRRTRWSRTARA